MAVKAKAGRFVQPLGVKRGQELGFADFEHLGAADGADALGGGAGVLHDDSLGILHVPLGAAFDTITLNGGHVVPPY